MKTKEQIIEDIFGNPLYNGCYHYPELDKLVSLAMEAYHEDKTRWISVEEGLPEESGYFNVAYFNPIAATRKLYTVTAYNGRNGWYWDNAEKEKAEDLTLTITHWQPLPTTPKINAE